MVPIAMEQSNEVRIEEGVCSAENDSSRVGQQRDMSKREEHSR